MLQLSPLKNSSLNKKTVILIIDGSLSDHLLSTPMLRGLRLKFPASTHTIVVNTLFHEIYGELTNGVIKSYNPNIDVLYSSRIKSDFYTKWAKNADVVLKQDIKFLPTQHLKDFHTTKLWCVVYDVPYDNNTLDFSLTAFEDLQAKQLYKMLDKPVVVIQPFGGYDPLQNNKITPNKDWEIPKWQVIIDHLVNKGYEVIQIGSIGEYIFNNVTSFVGHSTIRETIGIIKYCDFFISIDSFLVHAAKIFDKLGIVLWGRTNPYRVGYTQHYNIFKLHSCPEIFCGRPETAFYDFSPQKPYFSPWECPKRLCMESIGVQDICKGIDIIQRTLKLDPIKYERS